MAEKQVDLADVTAILEQGAPEPSPIRLSPSLRPQLGFGGPGVAETRTGCTVALDLGRLAAGRRQEIEVENLSPDPVRLRLETLRGVLGAAFGDGTRSISLAGDALGSVVFSVLDEAGTGPPFENLELVAESPHGIERRFRLAFQGEAAVALGRYDFQGSSRPVVHDFGSIDPLGPTSDLRSYVVAIDNAAERPVHLTFADLPAWLEVTTADGIRRRGPVPGPFFEADSPCRLVFQPVAAVDFLGFHDDAVLLETDDLREPLRRLTLPFRCRVGTEVPCVASAEVAPLIVATRGTYPVEVELLNWGRQAARLELEERSREVGAGLPPTLPAVSDGVPGRAVLALDVEVSALEAGTHELFVELRVPDGVPRKVRIPIRITRVAVEMVPEAVDLGRVVAGGRYAAAFSISAGGAELHPRARALAGSEDWLRVEVQGDPRNRRVEVLCTPPGGARPGRYDTLALELEDDRIHYRHRVPVRLRVTRGKRYWLLAAAVFLLVLLLALVVSLLGLMDSTGEQSAEILTRPAHAIGAVVAFLTV